eukprot:scaffold28047_cov223-Skeletonema_menzelii.AAC.2
MKVTAASLLSVPSQQLGTTSCSLSVSAQSATPLARKKAEGSLSSFYLIERSDVGLNHGGGRRVHLLAVSLLLRSLHFHFKVENFPGRIVQ